MCVARGRPPLRYDRSPRALALGWECQDIHPPQPLRLHRLGVQGPCPEYNILHGGTSSHHRCAQRDRHLQRAGCSRPRPRGSVSSPTWCRDSPVLVQPQQAREPTTGDSPRRGGGAKGGLPYSNKSIPTKRLPGSNGQKNAGSWWRDGAKMGVFCVDIPDRQFSLAQPLKSVEN